MKESIDYWEKRSQVDVEDQAAIGIPAEFPRFASLEALPVERMKEGVLLDIGSGYGRLAIPLTKAGFKVVGLEASRSMANRLRRNARQSKCLGFLDIVLGDGRYLPFRDAAFDTAICYATIYCLHKNHWLTVFRESSRVLLQDGVFIADFKSMSLSAIRRALVVSLARFVAGRKIINEYLSSPRYVVGLLKSSGFARAELIGKSNVMFTVRAALKSMPT